MIELLTNSLYRKFYGGLPPVSIKGVASTEDSEVYAVCAIAVIGGENFIIFDSKAGVNKRDIIKGWRRILEMMDYRQVYYVIIDRDLGTAPSLLRHFNFTHLEDDTYIYEGG